MDKTNKSKLYRVITGPAINGHLFGAHEINKAVSMLVSSYADATGLDVHPAEATLHWSQQCSRGTVDATGTPILEVRVGSHTVATLREAMA